MSLTAQELEAQMPDATQLLSDEPEMESSLHYAQLALLVSCLEWLWRDQSDFFIGANLTVYFSRQQLKDRDFRGPDFFLVKQTSNQPRNSWVVWEEDGRYPNLIIELLSNSTAAIDRGLKKDLYQTRFRTPEYFWFSPETLEFAGFYLTGSQYQPISPSPQGWLWSQELELYLGVLNSQLRYFTAQGALVPTVAEEAQQQMQQVLRIQALADQAKLEADQAKLEADQAKLETKQAEVQLAQERQRVEQLAAQLQALGLDPDAMHEPQQ